MYLYFSFTINLYQYNEYLSINLEVYTNSNFWDINHFSLAARQSASLVLLVVGLMVFFVVWAEQERVKCTLKPAYSIIYTVYENLKCNIILFAISLPCQFMEHINYKLQNILSPRILLDRLWQYFRICDLVVIMWFLPCP